MAARGGAGGRGSRKGSSTSGTKPKAASYADFSRMNQASSAVAGIIDVLRSQLKGLEDDIKADREGVREYEIELEKIEKQREGCRERLAKNKAWAAKFDKEIGPFEKKYHTLTIDISGLYDNAKNEHLKGLQLLMQEFEYHPEFKRHGDTFSAVPFRPK